MDSSGGKPAPQRKRGPRVSNDFLQKLKEAVSLVDVVSEVVVLKKSGANYSGLCPFHSERSPSFSVSESKQLYHCYGCKAGGDLIEFMKQVHGLSFVETIEDLAERAKIPLPKEWDGADADEDPEVAKRRAAQRERLAMAYKLNRFVQVFYSNQLADARVGAPFQKYFYDRGVHGDLARSFYVGAAVPAWDALARHLSEKKAPLPVAVDLGLIRASSKGNSVGIGFYDLFRARAMFPIVDQRGKVVGFGGRILPGLMAPGGRGASDSSDSKGDGPKYVNSAGSFIFQKEKVAYGLYQAAKHIREKDEVILVEGYFDVLALHAAGFQNAVATCGTALTPHHLQLFKRLASKVTVLFDADKGGISGTLHAMEVGLDQGWVLHGANLPEGLDPDELLIDPQTGGVRPEGVEQMKGVLGAAKPLLDTRIEEVAQEASRGPEAQSQALKRVAGWLARYQDPVGREVRVQALSKALQLPPALVLRAVQGGGASVVPPAAVKPMVSARPARPPQPLSSRDRVLLMALAWGQDLAPLFSEARASLLPGMTTADLFDAPVARAFVQALASQPGLFEAFRGAPEQLLQGDLDPQVRAVLTEAWVSKDRPVEKSELRHALGQGVRRALERFSQRLRAAIAEAEAKKDAGLEAQYKQEYLDVQRRIKEFSSFYDEA